MWVGWQAWERLRHLTHWGLQGAHRCSEDRMQTYPVDPVEGPILIPKPGMQLQW